MRKKNNHYKDATKEERAKALGNVICKQCGYQNNKYFAEKYGTCHCCGNIINSIYLKNKLIRK